MAEFAYSMMIRGEKTIEFSFCIVFVVLFFLSCSKIKIDNGGIIGVEDVPNISDKSRWDIPANEGVRNALLNADQLVSIKYQPIASLNMVGGAFDAGTLVSGLVYSSTRAEDLFVPNNVTLWTFISALKNPNSYPYTVDISKPPYSIRGLAKPYYGQVCSSFVQYALGIKYNFQILQMTVWDGFDRIDPQDINQIRLGDVMITLSRHVMMITGIRRVGNRVVELELSEGGVPCARKTLHPVQFALDLMRDGYAIFRYRYISDTKHSYSPFVPVGGSMVVSEVDWPVDFMVPRRGDKANWRKNENVVVDVLSRNGYSSYRLFKDGFLIDESPIPVNNILDFGVMPYGNYRLCLSNDMKESRSVYWIVADYSISVESLGDSTVKVSFSSKNAIPVWMTWRRPTSENSNYNGGPQWTTVISESDVNHGFVISKLDPIIEDYYGLGYWDFKVAFETEYGIISSDSIPVLVK